MNSIAKLGFCGLYKYSGLMSLQESLTRWIGGPFMSILAFHRVTDEVPEDDLTVSTARFEQMCRMLRRRFRVVPLAEVFRIFRCGEPFPARTVAITFDDGYRDNLRAAQTLARHGLPACFFLSTAYMGTREVFPWDRHLPALAKLTWDDVRAMDRMGFEIGSHTHTHPDLGAIPLNTVRYELTESKRVLEHELGHAIHWFAYPFGRRECLPAERLPLVAEAGYEGCVSAYGGFVYREADGRMLPRECVPVYGPLVLELRLSGCLNWLYRFQNWLTRTGREEKKTESHAQGTRFVCNQTEP